MIIRHVVIYYKLNGLSLTLFGYIFYIYIFVTCCYIVYTNIKEKIWPRIIRNLEDDQRKHLVSYKMTGFSMLSSSKTPTAEMIYILNLRYINIILLLLL